MSDARQRLPTARLWQQPPLLAVAVLGVVLGAAWVACVGGLTPVFPAQMSAMDRVRMAEVPLGRYIAVVLLAASNLPLIAVMWVSALGWGWVLRPWLRDHEDRVSPAVQLASGVTLLLMAVWIVAWAGWLNRWTGTTLLVAGIAVLVQRLWRERWFEKTLTWQTPAWAWALLLAAPAVGILLVACCCPPTTLWRVEAYGYDVTSYHLQLPQEWLALGRMAGLKHNVYSFLPSLGETAYMLVGAMMGTVYEGIYAAQMLHASFALLTAWLLAGLVRRHCGGAAAVLATAVFLATPWTIITGSLAYNEMFALALGAAALRLVLRGATGEGPAEWRQGAVIGLLLGGSIMAKLTAGPMVAMPVGLVLLAGPARQAAAIGGRWRRPLVTTAAAVLTALLTITPYLVRNAAQTGNPVFPFATSVLGTGHWTAWEAQRWDRGHHVSETWRQRLAELGLQWFCNAGYGGVWGWERSRASGEIESRNIARFGREWGWPTLWLLTPVAAGIALSAATTRPVAWRLIVVLIVQIIAWMTVTHLQARFLIWTLLPAVPLIAVGMHELSLRLPWRRFLAGHVLMAILAVILTICSTRILARQTIQNAIPWQLVDSLPALQDWPRLEMGDAIAGDHVINHLAPHTRTYLVADASRMLYIRRPVKYESAFDRSYLGSVIRACKGDPAAVTAALRADGITHVWVHHQELNRLMATYEYDPDVTPAKIAELARAGWNPVFQYPGVVTLYELPGVSQPVEPAPYGRPVGMKMMTDDKTRAAN